jgi:hypothetical protein
MTTTLQDNTQIILLAIAIIFMYLSLIRPTK